MAYGIDICAHREALKNNLPTIGVLAHGLHTLYPSVHRATAREAEQNGGLLTEYTSQQPILKINFVARNRIVAGMTEATLVIESPEKGGALITAHLARDYNREVFALPGNINQECSTGCNRLIRDNVAALVTSAEGHHRDNGLGNVHTTRRKTTALLISRNFRKRVCPASNIA